MATEKPTRRETTKRSPRRKADGMPGAERTPAPETRQLVDIDPWAVLLEGLMEMPEERATAERKGTKRK